MSIVSIVSIVPVARLGLGLALLAAVALQAQRGDEPDVSGLVFAPDGFLQIVTHDALPLHTA